MGGNGSGRPPVEIDMEAALDLIMRGEKIPAIAHELGISAPTLRKKINDLQKDQGVLLNYRAVQSLQLTALQSQILDRITPEKIEQASLKDLVLAYKILKEKELVLEGKPNEIKGLVAHLIYMEKQERALANGEALPEPYEEATYEEDPPSDKPENLSAIDDQRF